VVVLVLAVLLAATVVACSATPATESASSVGAPRTWNVPGDKPTIAEAVADAHVGDLVLVGPGRYAESIDVTMPGITIRGTDRNDVVLDGGYRLPVGISVRADGVAIENLTLRGFTGDAIRVGAAPATTDAPAPAPAAPTTSSSSAPTAPSTATSATATASSDAPGSGRTPNGYRIAHVTVANSGGAGIEVTGGRGGLIDHVFASALAGGALVVVGCAACDLVVVDSVLQSSRVGIDLDGTSSIVVARSTVRRNRSGIRVAVTGPAGAAGAPASAAGTAPFDVDQAVTIVGVDVTDNDSADAAAAVGQPWGDGIVVSGAGVAVLRNRVTGHPHAGIWFTGDLSTVPARARIDGNVLADNGIDLLVGSVTGPLSMPGTCFEGNTLTTTSPPSIATEQACGASVSTGPWPIVVAPDAGQPGRDFRLVPLPPPQPSMPGRTDSSPAPVDPWPSIDLAAVTAPSGS